ncbi:MULTISPECIES: hypothetical protein [unclassified Haloferax]|uniref:hypothetical protein n=1 Tax=Haloferax TaxID=2251 RepID=UPI000E22AC55|nr:MULTISPECIES: hypothetical protein [unclassified Haloferax]RDZ37884.1 hypothetical protein C5B88_07275 [Haloferax sp. Atlit-24N]RLM38679.1 hypothetical protein DVK03_07275 [Haloferax sp. Atlit-109R]RLM46627.1 hypothetical protein DVK04_07295 [Haloferax sp. Atlit-105R]
MSSRLFRQYRGSVYAVAGFLGVLVFAYAAVVAYEPLAGFFAGGTVVFGAVLLSDIAERGYPPALGRRGTLALVTVVVALPVFWFVVQRPLMGLGLAPLVAVVAWGLARFKATGYPESMGRRRSLATAFVGTGLVAYGSFSGATAFLVGIAAAVLVGLASWLTSPRGPLRGRLTD